MPTNGASNEEPQYQTLENMSSVTQQQQPTTSGPSGQNYDGYYQEQMMVNYERSSEPQPTIDPSRQQQQTYYNRSDKNNAQSYLNTDPSRDEEEEETAFDEAEPEDSDGINKRMFPPGRYTPPVPVPRKLGVLLDQERFLPIANVARIMKGRVDPNGKISKEAKECIQECVSEFIGFLSSEAADACNRTKRKTITADDLLTALEATGFDNYSEPMRLILMKYRQANKLTGPVYRPHHNYVRPEVFANDPQIQPLSYETENGNKSVEAPAEGDFLPRNPNWPEMEMEQEGAPETEEVYQEEIGHQQDVEVQKAMDAPAEMIIRRENGEDLVMTDGTTVPVQQLQQQNQMQIYVDPTTKQHYAAVETENGLQLYPITIQDDPVINVSPQISTDKVVVSDRQDDKGAQGDDEPSSSGQKMEVDHYELAQQELEEFIVPNSKTRPVRKARTSAAEKKQVTPPKRVERRPQRACAKK